MTPDHQTTDKTAQEADDRSHPLQELSGGEMIAKIIKLTEIGFLALCIGSIFGASLVITVLSIITMTFDKVSILGIIIFSLFLGVMIKNDIDGITIRMSDEEEK